MYFFFFFLQGAAGGGDGGVEITPHAVFIFLYFYLLNLANLNLDPPGLTQPDSRTCVLS